MKLISGKELIIILEKNGWTVLRSKGSHFSLKKPGVNKILTVPVHGNEPLRPGTLKKLLRLAGLCPDDL
jgi:predicted RNA binding protein YcfA (HicA-like mRNA interferase family)